MREAFNPPACQPVDHAICAMQERSPLVSLSTWASAFTYQCVIDVGAIGQEYLKTSGHSRPSCPLCRVLPSPPLWE